MLGLSLVCSALLGADPVASPEGARPGVAAAYSRAAACAGRDAEAHARLALWCEANGLTAERTKHLALAVMTDPGHALARGLLGLVDDGGRWRRADDVAGRVRADAALSATLADYRAKRAAASPSADGQWKLALWCESRGLKDESRAHLMAVLRLDPRRDEAWKRLGYKKHEGVWRTDEQIAGAKAEIEAQHKADRTWRPQLEKWKAALDDQPTRREAAEQGLAGITDPRAVPVVMQVLAKSHPARAVQVLGQIDSPGAARALAFLAVFSPDESARRMATETLRHYDPREFAASLVGLVRDPIQYEVKPVGGPGSPGELLVEGKKFDVKRLYAPPVASPAQLGLAFEGYDRNGIPIFSRAIGWYRTGWQMATDMFPVAFGFDRPGLYDALSPVANARYATQWTSSDPFGWTLGPGVANMILGEGSSTQYGWSPTNANLAMLALMNMNMGTALNITVERRERFSGADLTRDARNSAVAAQQRLEQDIRAIEAYNAPIRALNERVLPVLQVAAGADLGPKRLAWENWWVDQLGYAQRHEPQYRPTVVESVPIAFQPQAPAYAADVPIEIRRVSCFGKGTLVRTLDGPQPIESIAVGDRVLSQDTATGALGFEPVLVVHHNPPSPTLRVELEDGESIVASTFHRFWLAGDGWRMARDLKAGDPLRTLGGTARVKAVEAADVQPVFNLDVADGHSFFVGKQGALVHDNSVPGTRVAPFDAHSDLTTAE
jgi:hypothetical protein